MQVVLMVIAALLLGALVVFFLLSRRQQRELSHRIEALTESSADVRSVQLAHERELLREEAARLQDEAARTRAESERSFAARLAEIRERRQALEAREIDLHRREDDLSAEHATLLTEREEGRRRRRELEQRAADLDEREAAALAEAERIAGLSVEAARAEVLAEAERDATQRALSLQRAIVEKAQQEADQTARDIVTTTIQRIAAEQTAESVVSTLELPSDDVKGRIIGREGRNIRAFEQITGVNVMIDDTPGSVLISCFDPVRRETARLTLAELVADGRIQPVRIEEAYESNKRRVGELCAQAANEALATLGINDLHPDLVELVGSLRFRTSYGQNVLAHTVECGRLAGAIASELGLNPRSCIRAAFLHDIGKAIVTNGDGSHALEGAAMAKRCGESPEIVNAIGSHHNEVAPNCVEAIIAQVADTISGSRPGARRESLEAYVHRLERLEEIASAHPGVDRVFAMQAGREVRVMVSPASVDDAGSATLAQAIAKQVEDELTYPGNIRITVVRESRATEIAH